MDGQQLQSNITAACPLAFGGTSGSLFVGAVAAVVLAQCAIFNDYSWPNDRAQDIFSSSENVYYDFIIVGAGTAGSLVAGRLAQLYPSWSVLLVEAGGDPGLDSEVPAFLFQNQNSDFDWQYKTYPDGKSCLGFNNDSCYWSKGKALGGSSSINAMLYIRGHPKDFDDWEKNGNTGWGYNELLPYFEKLERELELPRYEFYENPLYEIVENAWKELGFAKQTRDHDEAHVGLKLTKLLIKEGRRLNTAKIYLKPYTNLHVMKNTLVQKIIIDKRNKITKGIEVMNRNGFLMQIDATKEIILSAGSIATPQLLMLSGLGPRVHLEHNNIDCLVDLPVGHNLQDHVLLPLFLKSNIKQSLSTTTIVLMLLQYMLTKTGPLSQIGVIDFMGFIDTENAGFPDIQFHHTYYTTKDDLALKPYLQLIGYKTEIINLIRKLNEDNDLLGIFPTLIHPKSNGKIVLADGDPHSLPKIKSNYFHDAQDIQTLLKAIQFIHKLEGTDTFKSRGLELLEIPIADCITFPSKTDQFWECYIRHMATTTYHPVGTAKMGHKTDPTAVVDNNLLVHGVKGLRVVDASVIPRITGGNTMAPTLVIAEKAVDIIQQTFSSVKNEEEL